MPAQPLVKIKALTAAEVCAHFDLEEEAQPLLRDGMAPRDFVQALVAGKQYDAAVDFLAHALPAREAVWWGCLCLQHACGNKLAAPDRAAAAAAVQWVLRPTEQNRAAAKATGEAAKPPSPAGALAQAANWTGGSLGPPHSAPIPPGPFMPAMAVATAVKFAAIKVEPVRIPDTQRLFVELGIAVAEGRYLWKVKD
jgi:hypothetical protein